MDWAIKFLPRKHREKQEDFFAKKGLSWHLTCIVYKEQNTGEFKSITLIHLFQSVSQDSDCVLCIIDSVFKYIRVIFGESVSRNLRSDNAGCYHCSSIISLVPLFAQKHSLLLARIDFCEPQTGKDICDRKISPIKRSMIQYIDDGNV